MAPGLHCECDQDPLHPKNRTGIIDFIIDGVYQRSGESSREEHSGLPSAGLLVFEKNEAINGNRMVKM